jgi:hypothetical protein
MPPREGGTFGFTSGMASHEELYATGPIRTATALRPLFVAVAVVGAILGVASDWGPGAVLMVAGAAGTLAAQLVVGIAAYRRAMASEWPDVTPIVGDDWD